MNNRTKKIFTIIISRVDLEWNIILFCQLDEGSQLLLLGKERNVLAHLKVDFNCIMIVLG